MKLQLTDTHRLPFLLVVALNEVRRNTALTWGNRPLEKVEEPFTQHWIGADHSSAEIR